MEKSKNSGDTVTIQKIIQELETRNFNDFIKWCEDNEKKLVKHDGKLVNSNKYTNGYSPVEHLQVANLKSTFKTLSNNDHKNSPFGMKNIVEEEIPGEKLKSKAREYFINH